MTPGVCGGNVIGALPAEISSCRRTTDPTTPAAPKVRAKISTNDAVSTCTASQRAESVQTDHWASETSPKSIQPRPMDPRTRIDRIWNMADAPTATMNAMEGATTAFTSCDTSFT